MKNKKKRLGSSLSDQTKENIMKTLVCLGGGSFLMIFPGLVVLSFFIDEPLMFLYYPLLGSAFGFGFLFMILIPFFGDSIKLKPVPAEQVAVNFSPYSSILNQLEDALKRQGYKETNPEVPVENLNYKYYCRKRYFTWLSVSIVQEPEMTKEAVKSINRVHRRFIKNLFGFWRSDRPAGHISLYLIDHENEQSSKLVNNNIYQQYQRFYLPAYILSSNGRFFIARQKDGFGTARYRQLRKELKYLLRRIEKSNPDATIND